MCSSGSTSNSRPAPPIQGPAFRGLVVVGLACALGGCAGGGRRAAPPVSVRGYARLDALVRRHPGWVGLARYDEALGRLAQAAGRPPASAPPDTGLAALPPSPEGPLIGPAPTLAGERARLGTVQRVQVARLQGRQAQNRRRQIALETPVWERQAAAQYTRTVTAAQTAYAQRLARPSSDARRLNLPLQIRALQKIVAGWKASTPPTPALNRAEADLQAKQGELSALDQDRQTSMREAAAARDAMLAAALRARSAFVSTQAALEEARLRGQDDRQAASLQDRLARQRAALLHEDQSLSAAPVPPADGLGPQALPPGPVPATSARGAGHSFRLAEAQLKAQRDRWRAFLYSDTRAAALDVAAQRHWVVAFGPPHAGERDLTAPLAQALVTRVWKS